MPLLKYTTSEILQALMNHTWMVSVLLMDHHNNIFGLLLLAMVGLFAVLVIDLIMHLIKLLFHLLMLAITTSVMVTTMVHCGMR